MDNTNDLEMVTVEVTFKLPLEISVPKDASFLEYEVIAEEAAEEVENELRKQYYNMKLASFDIKND